MQPAPQEIGDPAEDSRAFRRALGQFATGVTIVTAEHEGRLAGLTVNSFASVSLAPPLVLCSLARTSRALPVFEQAERLAINVLACDQVELATQFAGASNDKFTGVDWCAGLGGVPLLDGVAASLECRIRSRLDGGDHVIYLSEVLRFARHERAPLLYANGRFGLVVEYPAGADEAEAQRPIEPGESMLGLLWGAFSRMSGKFQADRDAEGLSIDQARVLAHVERHAGASAEFIAGHSFLGQPVVEDALAGLRDAGLVARLGDGTHALTEAGRRRVDSLRQRARNFEARQFDGIAPEDLQAVRRVLEKMRGGA